MYNREGGGCSPLKKKGVVGRRGGSVLVGFPVASGGEMRRYKQKTQKKKKQKKPPKNPPGLARKTQVPSKALARTSTRYIERLLSNCWVVGSGTVRGRRQSRGREKELGERKSRINGKLIDVGRRLREHR